MSVLKAMNRFIAALVRLALLTVVMATARAEDHCETGCVDVGDWEFGIQLGYSHIPNPLFGGEELRWPLLLRFSGYGERFFIETGTVGYTLVESEGQRLNLIATPNLDFFYFAESHSVTAMLAKPFQPYIPVIEYLGPPPAITERKLTYLAGMEYSAFAGPWQLQLKAGTDVTVGHDGYEVWASVKHHWQHDKFGVFSSLGAIYRDDKLSQYYYGINANDTMDSFWYYEPKASWSPYGSINLVYSLSESLSLLLMVAAQKPDDTIRNSPIVLDDWFTASFIGIDYAF